MNNFKPVIEALLFSTDIPLTKPLLLKIVEELDDEKLEETIDALNQEYELAQRSFRIVKAAEGYLMQTCPEFAYWIKKLYTGRTTSKLTQASLEALAIVAFKQPLSKGDVSAVRGVNSDGVMKNLLERKLIRISGRSSDLGRPLLYSTTPEFLEYFGINKIDDLPRPREIEELLGDARYTEEIVSALSEIAEEEATSEETLTETEGESENENTNK